MKIDCSIQSMGLFVPETVLTNDDLAKFVDTNNDWIVERTGIRQRHRINENGSASELGLNAAKKVLASTGIKSKDLTHVIVATCTPDYLSPSVACIISGKLETGPVMAFDIGAACTGFIYGLSVCRSILSSDPDSVILFVSTEALSRRLNWKDRSTCVLFGDAATACIIRANYKNPLFSLEDVICESDGSLMDLIIVGGGTACKYNIGDEVDSDFFISMQGRETYKHAVRQMVQVCEKILAKNGLTIDDINLFVPHQANLRIIEAVGNRLKINPDSVYTNVNNYGNTSAASIPLALVEAHHDNRLHAGDLVLMTAFGAGLTFGAALLKFEPSSISSD